MWAHPTSGPDRGKRCAPEGIRTPNLLIRSQMLYPLSYGRMVFICSVAADPGQVARSGAEAPGFEPGMGGNPKPH